MLYIQTSNPKVKKSDYEADDLSDALEEIFDLYTESAIIFVNGQAFPLSYKYDISEIICDVIEIVRLLQRHDFGQRIIQFASSSFAYNWTISLMSEIATITLRDEVAVASGQRPLDSTTKVISLNKIDLICEFVSLIKFTYNSINESGITIRDQTELDHLYRISSEANCTGILYRSA